MYICKYCLRNLKYQYETCPGCGASQFEKVADFREKVIKTPPAGGYKVELNSYNYELKNGKIFKYIGYVLIAIVVFLLIFFFDFRADKGIFLMVLTMLFFFLGLAIFFVKEGKSQEEKSSEAKKKVEKLSKSGMLIKNLDYEIINMGTDINITRPTYQIKVLYKNQTGVKVPFISNVKFDRVPTGVSGTADLLVDPSDYSNYYVDFEIV